MNRRTAVIALVFAMGLVMFSCRKGNKEQIPGIPTNFLDLRVNQSFLFENFSNLKTAIQLSTNKAAGTEIIQIYDAHPSNGGKLILTGSANQNGVFNLPIRIASRLDEVYVAKLSSVGVNEYVAVPISGSTIQFNFTAAKTVTAVSEWCDCEPSQYLANGFNANLEIVSGETKCVAEGDFVTIKKLKLHAGGTLNICGTVTIQKMYDYSGGTISISPSGSATVQEGGMPHNIDNYGNLEFSSEDGDIEYAFNNWGTVNSTVKLEDKGVITNHGTFTTSKEFKINSDGSFINHCQFYIQSSSSKAPASGGSKDLKQEGSFENYGYVRVKDNAEFKGSGSNKTTLGLGSLIDCGEFKIEGEIVGPTTQGSQITAEDDSETKSGSSITGHVDLWMKDGELDKEGFQGPNVTYHAYALPAPNCAVNVAPTITSSLQHGGIVNQAITPYIITATGTEPISYDATNLPAGLSFNASTHTITGTPTTAGTYNIPLTASNFMGDDNKTLVLEVTQPTAAPVITSTLTASATVNQSFTYELTASGTGPITYDATNLPGGLSFDANTHLITGSPTTAGDYNINLFATNAGGTTDETLVLTVGTPPAITSPLTASGTAGDQFVTYTVTGTGSPTITYTASNLPSELSFDPSNNTINGTPTSPGVAEVSLTATNSYGTDVQTLVITIAEGTQPPLITSSLTAEALIDFPFSYTITATGSQPMTFGASDLPAGLTINGSVISGIPTEDGTFNIPLTATNGAGTDPKILVLTVATGSGTDTDGDGIPDNLDAYPTDPTRAFNSYYPNEVNYASVAFEDLWPGYGDYDFNDFVVNLNFKMVTNAQNAMVDVIIKFQIMADGASLKNGFGLVFNAPPSSVESVTGYIQLGNAVVLDPAKGYEAGHTDETVIIPIDDINPIMEGGMANTIPGGKYVQTTVNMITTHFSTPQASIGTPPFNPFIFVNQVRSHEVHLKNQPPTEFADPDLFGTYSDASIPSEGLYYRSTTGLPWGIETPVNFNYPIEKADILSAYLKFAAWAQSSGVDYPDWYTNEPGYRNAENIYVIP